MGDHANINNKCTPKIFSVLTETQRGEERVA
jgi:hypothetical protein